MSTVSPLRRVPDLEVVYYVRISETVWSPTKITRDKETLLVVVSSIVPSGHRMVPSFSTPVVLGRTSGRTTPQPLPTVSTGMGWILGPVQADPVIHLKP